MLFLRLKISKLFHQALAYFKYLLQAKSVSAITDENCKRQMSKVLDKERYHYPFVALDVVRSKNLADERILSVDDLGAGSKTTRGAQRSVKAIAKGAVKQKKYAQALYRLVEVYQPAQVLEIGTSLGITTGYLAKANKSAQIVTLEGVNSIADVARENLKLMDVQNVQLIQGNFEDTLPKFLSDVKTPLDFVFMDGNHRLEPTLRYFEWLLPHLSSTAIIVIDDIYWSPEMTSAWKKLSTHPKVVSSIDLFEMGILFLNGHKTSFSGALRY